MVKVPPMITLLLIRVTAPDPIDWILALLLRMLLELMTVMLPLTTTIQEKMYKADPESLAMFLLKTACPVILMVPLKILIPPPYESILLLTKEVLPLSDN